MYTCIYLNDCLALHSHEGLTKVEVMGNTILFLSAGFQTTADSMSTLFYELAMNPDCQQKVTLHNLSTIKNKYSPYSWKILWVTASTAV